MLMSISSSSLCIHIWGEQFSPSFNCIIYYAGLNLRFRVTWMNLFENITNLGLLSCLLDFCHSGEIPNKSPESIEGIIRFLLLLGTTSSWPNPPLAFGKMGNLFFFPLAFCLHVYCISIHPKLLSPAFIWVYKVSDRWRWRGYGMEWSLVIREGYH